MQLPSAESMAETVPGVMVIVPASTVIASGEVSSSGTVTQRERMSALRLNRMIIATWMLATTMSQSTTSTYSIATKGWLTLGRFGQ